MRKIEPETDATFRSHWKQGTSCLCRPNEQLAKVVNLVLFYKKAAVTKLLYSSCEDLL